LLDSPTPHAAQNSAAAVPHHPRNRTIAAPQPTQESVARLVPNFA
jgi:hypothetical protein